MALFLKLDGIVGDSTSSEFSGWIEIQSFSWGASNPANTSSGGGGGAGKVSFSDIVITKTISRGSPYLALACASGKHISGGEIAETKPTGNGKEVTYLTYKLTDVLVTSYQTGGDVGGRPSESISLNFTRLEIDYKGQDSSGRFNEDVILSRDVIGA
jgi:type VI secretion system secreted protein Hcp